ncbi:MAG: proprotein convertase P-domain-containing protein [Myxococcota bacterium]
MLIRSGLSLATLTLALAAAGCDSGSTGGPGSGGVIIDENAPNPLLDEGPADGKADTQYYNPNGVEIEVTLESDIDAPSSRKGDGPAIQGQFALTYFRRLEMIYIESLAEQASSSDRVEWLVDGAWKTARQASSVSADKLTHYRITGINAVLLDGYRNGVDVGKVFEAPVPKKPFTLMSDVGGACAEEDNHIGLDQSVYWYLWDPDKAGCSATKTTMKITVTKMLPSKVPYPEWDLLTADGKVTMVILFGLIDDELSKTETGYKAFTQMASWLKQGSFTEVKPAPVGRRFTRTVGGKVIEIDLYSPYDFSGLGDYAHFPNFQKALAEHEIVTYDGHSMLGASDFWSRPTYPSFYQIFLYGGCLGYEYYVAPILAGKGGWDKLDMLSAVVEVSANANEFAGPFISKMITALGNGYKTSWKDILGAIRTRVGDSTFGMSGVRDNCFSPAGPQCGSGTTPVTPTGKTNTYSSTGGAVAIPDASSTGVTSRIDVKDDFTLDKVTVKLKITHSYIGDLVVTLEHGTVKKTVWDGQGTAGANIDKSFDLTDFAGKSSKGVWTLKVVDSEAVDTGTLDSWSITATSK